MADTSGSDDSASEYITITPKVFLSYRRADARDVAEILSERLRKDLGSTNVFRDEEDLIAGQVWRDVLANTIALSDATLILVGNDWTGEQPDGSRRIDEPTDVVRVEVNRALASANRGVAV